MRVLTVVTRPDNSGAAVSSVPSHLAAACTTDRLPGRALEHHFRPPCLTSGLRAPLPAGRSFFPLLYGALAAASTPREVARSAVQVRARCVWRGGWDGGWVAVQGRALWDLNVDRGVGVLGLQSGQGSLSLLPGVPGHWAPQPQSPHVENVAFNIVRPHVYSLDRGSPIPRQVRVCDLLGTRPHSRR